MDIFDFLTMLGGLSLFLFGMSVMGQGLERAAGSKLKTILERLTSSPVKGFFLGVVVTAVIQSSSASVGILQALASSGVISYASSVFVLFGQNIGTCITAVLAAIGTNRNAKRATLIHLMFNLIGTAIFTTLFVLFPIAAVVEGTLVLPGEVGRTLSHLIPTDPMAQIAMTHTVFNITTTLVLLPLGNYLAKLAIRILPDQAVETEGQESMTLAYLTPIQAGGKEGGLGVSAIVIDQLRNELNRMLSMARDNVADSFRAVLARDQEQLVQVEQREEYIDFLNREISRYVSHLISIETNEQGSAVVSSFFTISGNIERIGDHADNLAGYTRMLVGKNISFSETAQSEISAMRDISLEAISALLHYQAGQPQWLSEVAQMEQKIDDMTDSFRRGQLQRMKEGTCNQEACILYSELLTDFERIGDHVLNIAEELTKAQTGL